MTRKKCLLPLLLLTAIMILGFSNDLHAQNNPQYIRIAKLVIDSTKLDGYRVALKEHAEAAVKVEPGVLLLYAVYEKNNPTHVNVFEIYANEEAYKSHIKTSHFLKYKSTVQDMVKSLELVDVAPIALESKKQFSN